MFSNLSREEFADAIDDIIPLRVSELRTNRMGQRPGGGSARIREIRRGIPGTLETLLFVRWDQAIYFRANAPAFERGTQ